MNCEFFATSGCDKDADLAENAEVNVSNNLAKARRTLYSLFGAGLHGENGLDPLTIIHLYRTYVLPVLLYRLELLLPSRKLID
jgi:outer membrane protein TolC